jgi:lipoate-protein ligase A
MLERFALPSVDALCGLDLDTCASGCNDIIVDGRKVSGTAQRLARGRALHHGTLLFDSDSSLIAGVLGVDPQKFRAKRA